MTTTWSGRVIPSMNEELGMEEVAPLTYRYVTRPVEQASAVPSLNHRTEPEPAGTSPRS
jgi:hypothetical protein